jgi:hypothetical protein
MMQIIFRASSTFMGNVRSDLARRHPFAAERVGYIGCRLGTLEAGVVLLALDYLSLDDDDYEDDPSAGATVGSNAIRKAITKSYRDRLAMFHVHEHPHSGLPWFSRTDIRENQKMVPDFFKVQPHLPHGAIVLSASSASAMCWLPQTRKPERVNDIVFVGSSMQIIRNCQGRF